MNRKFIEVVSFIFAVQPMLDVYGVGIKGVGLGKATMIVLAILCLIRKVSGLTPSKMISSIPRSFIPYAIWGLFVPLLFISLPGFSFNDFSYKTIAVLGFWLTFGFVCTVVDFCSFRKYLQNAAVLASAGLLLQIALYFVLGFYPPLVIPNLPLATGDSARELFIQYMAEDRPASFFLEPSNYAYYAVMGLALALLDSNGLKRNTKRILFLTITLIMSRSGSAYTLMSLVYIMYIFAYKKLIPTKIRSRIVIVLFLLPFGYYSLSSFEIVKGLTARANEFKLDDEQSAENSSGYLRIFRGFIVFNELDAGEKFVGIGHSNVEQFKKTHTSLMVDMNITDDEGLYLNGLSQIIIFCGFVGGGLFVLLLLPYFKNKKSRFFVLLLLVLSAISSTYNTDMKLLLFVCMVFYKQSVVRYSISK